MADNNDKAAKYEEVWSRVKAYIPFLQELISFHKNEEPSRPQTLEKITTMYELLTNQRLNYTSLCKCEGVLIKLYETNPMKKKAKVAVLPPSPEQPEIETPASPDAQVDPSTDSEQGASCKEDDQRTSSEVGECSKTTDGAKVPLTLDEIQRLITEKSQSAKSYSETGTNLSDAIRNTLKTFNVPMNDCSNNTSVEKSRVPVLPYNDDRSHQRGVRFSPQPYNKPYWSPGQDSSFPHAVNNAFVQNTEIVSRQKSPPLYRRRDDLVLSDNQMDISPDIRSPPVSVPHIKDPRLRKAASNAMGIQSPTDHSLPDNYNPYVPPTRVNDPRFNRTSVPTFTGPIPNELPKCLAPNPNLPLNITKKDPPKRRLSICANQMIIEEIPSNPLIPVKSFPARRQSICSDFGNPYNVQNEPFLPPQYPPRTPIIPPAQSAPIIHPQPIEIPSVAERDPRRKHLPPGAEYLPSSSNTSRYERPLPAASKKTPLTYLEYRRQKELREKQQQHEKQLTDSNKTSDEADIMIGMVPNKTRVAAKAYAKPAKAATNKERQFAPSPKTKTTPEPKPLYKQSHSFKKDKKTSYTEKQDKQQTSSKPKDLFGEQLSQFDKMYRSSDFSKKSNSGAIGGFKIPKLKRVEDKPQESQRSASPQEVSSKNTEEKNETHKQVKKIVSKSPEPNKSSFDDECWDEEPMPPPKPCDLQKTDTSEQKLPLNASTLLNDDDYWDNDPDPESIDSPKSESVRIQKEKKQNENLEKIFQVPQNTVPRRIMTRRNSVAVCKKDVSDYLAVIPVANAKLKKMKKRRNSFSVSEEIDDSQEDNSKDAEEEIRPRKISKRKKAVIADDEEEELENLTSVIDNSTNESMVNIMYEAKDKVDISSVTTIQSSSNNLEKTDEDNIVSSTTNEPKPPTKKRGRKCKKSAEIVSEDDASNDSSMNKLQDTAGVATEETEVKTEEAKQDENNKDILESILNQPSTNNKAQLLAMLSKLLDEKKVKKIQEIIESPSDKIATGQGIVQEPEASGSRERTSSMCISSTEESIPKDKASGKARKSELDKLNEDINEMYMRDGVLNATGRRRCTKKSEELTLTVTKRAKSQGPAKPQVNELLQKSSPTTPQLKNFKIVVKKMDVSKLSPVNRKRKMSEETNDNVSICSDGGTSFSPKSKKKRRSPWTSSRRKKNNTQSPVSPVKMFIPKTATKNVNRELHCKNQKSKECTLCSYSGRLDTIVQHYVRNHPLHEVYTSRFSYTTANKIKKEPMKISGTITDKNITFECLFCQETFTKMRYNWKLHLASHTGEYRYKCNNCTIKSLAPSTHAHDKDCTNPAMEVINELTFDENHLWGYMCRVCNYVQLSRDRIDYHLKEEHDRHLTSKGILKFSILNYYEPFSSHNNVRQEPVESDVSMPELTPQTPEKPVNMSAFIATDSKLDCGTLAVLSNSSFVSPSKPSIVDKLQKDLNEIAQNKSFKIDQSSASRQPKSIPYGDDDDWEDIESPQKNSSPKSVEKVKRCLRTSISEVPMPTPLAVKEEEVDLFEDKQIVSNFGFNRIADVIWYLCLIVDCKYASKNRIEMYEHVNQEHKLITWDGFCYLCTAQVTDDESNELTKEINHMAVVHIKDRSAADELHNSITTSLETSLDAGSKLKLRRFSSDKLSLGMLTSDAPEQVPINPKPWTTQDVTKSIAHCRNMLDDKSLYCFFKCMGSSCSYTTTLESSMEKHINNHELVGNLQNDQIVKSWLECSYCEFVADSSLNLIQHLRQSHGKCAYQCRYCFYRSRNSYNVVLHQQLYHPEEKVEVLMIESDKQPLTATDHEFLNKRRIENISPLICTVCEEEFFVLDAYMTHLKDDHPESTTIACQCCKEEIQKLKMPRHLLIHKIGIYECLYCQFGSNTVESVQTHVCNKHPSEPFYCCVRFNKGPEKRKLATLKSLFEQSIEESVFTRCNFTINELNYKSPDIINANQDVTKPTIIPLQLPPIRVGDANILLSAHIPTVNDSDKIDRQSVVVNADGGGSIQVPTLSKIAERYELVESGSVPIITSVQGNYQPATSSTNFPVITQVMGGVTDAQSSSSMPIITRVEGGVDNSVTIRPASSLIGTKIIISPNKGFPIITNVCSIAPSTSKQVQSASEDEALMLEAERVAMEMIKDTGLPRNVIYKCVFKGCNSVLPDGYGMRKHLMFTHMASTQYNCVHCKSKTTFPSVLTFTQHLKSHETQRIFCFVCDYKGSFPPEVIKHVKEVHKTNKPTILFLNPKKNDPNSDIIVFAPGQPTEAERKAYYQKLIDLYNHKLQEALIQQKTQFSPEECEMLPKQAIFSQLVYCNKCHYGTKVRLNMYRHLKGHLNDIPVANVDPKNPVPCWGQGEKHFDRMRNPAASSQEDDDVIQSLCFVQENKRYICGAQGCRYLTINECMLQSHLSTLHCDIDEYKCPHCPAVQVFSSGKFDAMRIVEHLKLHDKELYRCSICCIFLNNKTNMERHIRENHKNISEATVFVIRDGSTAGGALVEGIAFKWKCDICKFKCVTVSEIKSHMVDVHNMTMRYRCAKCLFGASNKAAFTNHFEEKHSGCKIVIVSLYKPIDGDDSKTDTTPLWRRETGRTKSIRGIEVEDDDDDNDDVETVMLSDSPEPAGPSGLCTSDAISKLDEDSTVKAFKCGFRACTFVNDFGSGIVAHFKTAHPGEKPSVLRNALANPAESRFDYFLKYACFYCIKKADTLSELKDHWKKNHTVNGIPNPEKPFLFKTVKIVLCFYCRKGSVMPEIKSHFAQCHPNMQPIYLDFRNPKQCAECDYPTNQKQEMVAHYFKHHQQENEYAKGWISYLNDHVLNKILELNSITFRCDKCEFSTDTSTDFASHFAAVHPGQSLEFSEYVAEKQIKYHCSFNNCKLTFTKPRDLANHLMVHVPMFKCCCDPPCNASFRYFSMLVQHYRTTHPNQDLKYALKTPNEYHTVLRMVSVQFWNGFVMTLEDARLANNRFGINSDVSKYVNEICDKSVVELTHAI
ncbi:uncharacterized protein LOC129743900 [Uranotaenia lowii]|uniref:uncharacterized protein LOC129743900 n=1 Tax=Uranotaenia lowii TaxID=190385 RepID=UPI002478F785|nr:uncharacterized protein LOC129743900 [Uranotaenia lowii]XP_055592114.1 uncharacterized protein LOC129743900 [Uranotaenia lowii]XP_055592115.1 uncharacterized protein LOC129743900 [Uranotaenia lowii]XP_055592116.1 uncharacterized protein LOC129743900 [Uranotaenia lowii]